MIGIENLQSIEMRYLYQIINSDDPIGKNVIVKHHNGDL